MRALLRRKPVFYAVSVGTLLGGSLILTARNVPEWAFLAYIDGLWAVLMYLLRWRNREGRERRKELVLGSAPVPVERDW